MRSTLIALMGILLTLNSIANTELEVLWNDLIKEEEKANLALLKLSKTPEETTMFLQKKLEPLKIEKHEVVELISKLDNKSEWKAAADKLCYFDPRLSIDLEDLLELPEAESLTTRLRLVAILSGTIFDVQHPFKEEHYKSIELVEIDDRSFNFVGYIDESRETGASSWWAECNISRINSKYSNQKQHWRRVTRSLALLKSISTNNALEIIEKFTNGHPDASPTIYAKSLLKE